MAATIAETESEPVDGDHARRERRRVHAVIDHGHEVGVERARLGGRRRRAAHHAQIVGRVIGAGVGRDRRLRPPARARPRRAPASPARRRARAAVAPSGRCAAAARSASMPSAASSASPSARQPIEAERAPARQAGARRRRALRVEEERARLGERGAQRQLLDVVPAQDQPAALAVDVGQPRLGRDHAFETRLAIMRLSSMVLECESCPTLINVDSTINLRG